MVAQNTFFSQFHRITSQPTNFSVKSDNRSRQNPFLIVVIIVERIVTKTERNIDQNKCAIIVITVRRGLALALAFKI